MKRTHTRIAALLALCTPMIALAAFDPQAMRQKYTVSASFHLLGSTGAEMRDIDGVPGEELLIGHVSMWRLLQWDSKNQTFSQLAFHENGVGNIFGGGGLRIVRFAALEPENPVEVAALNELGQIGLFALDGSIRKVWKPAVGQISRMRFADLDDIPGDEVVFQTCSELTAWHFGSSTPLWRIAIDDCAAWAIAQLDSDPQPEIALGTGRVFDTRTATQQWRFPLEFGTTLTTADVNGDGIRDLIGCRGAQCDAYDVAAQTTLWETFLRGENGVITAADVDFDGKPEIFGGSSQHGEIRKISGTTGELLAEFDKSGGTNFVVVGNLDGDCDLELVWGKDADSTAVDTFFVTDPITMETFWSSNPEDIGSSGLLFEDFSGTGHPTLLWNNQAGAVLRFIGFNPALRVSREVSEFGESYSERFPVAAAAQLDSDSATEYVLSLANSESSRDWIGVYDGATHALEWAFHPTQDLITSITTGDLTGDGVSDIVVGSSILYFPARHPQKVVAVDGAKRTFLWATEGQIGNVLSAACDGCIVQVAIRDLDADGTSEVLALVPSNGLFAFDGKSGARRWEREGLAGAWAFTVADIDPSAGPEIIVPFYGSGRLAVYDATATTVLRETNLGEVGSGLGVQVADLDTDGSAEILVVADGAVVVLSAQTLDILWSGGFVLPWFSLGNQIVIADVDGDSTLEIAVPSAHSLHVFEYRRAVPDLTPPAFATGELKAAAVSACCAISLQWPEAADAASMPVRYRVYGSQVPGFVPNASTLIGETNIGSYLHPELAAGQAYFYAVTAVDSAGTESAPLRVATVGPENCRRARRRAVGRGR